MADSTVRVFVGGISFELSKSIADLESRISKYGEIVSSFDIHHNKVQDVYFGFVTLKISDSKMKSLKRVLNGAKFKGSKLIIDIAKPDWKEQWASDANRQDTGIRQRKLRAKVTARRMERIEHGNMNPFKLALVSEGRMRTSKRKDLKNSTIRIEINGRVRIVKCKKNKLWGIAKNRGIKDLTARFIAGEWRDGNEHVIDRLAKKIIIFDNSGIRVQDYETEEPVQGELLEEKEKTNLVLEGLLSKYNFDKPLALQEDEDEEKAGSDYELERHSDNEENDSSDEVIDVVYQVPQKDCVKPSQESVVKQYLDQYKELLDKPILPLPEASANDEEDDDDEFYKALTTKFNNDDDGEIDSVPSTNLDKNPDGPVEDIKDFDNKHEHDDEFIPTFGSKSAKDETENVEEENEEEEFIPTIGNKVASEETENVEESADEEFIPAFGVHEPVPDTNNNTTETLRALLNPVNVKNDIEEVEPSMEIMETGHTKRNLGLFFGHFDSPFLVAQSQINKFNDLNVEQELQWDKWFWENRGELNREFRRRRRDVLKRNRKNNSKTITI